MRRLGGTLMLGIALSMCGCGDTGGPAPTQDLSVAVDLSAGNPADMTSSSSAIQVKEFSFEPNTLTVAKGTTVVWQWVGGAPHTVTSGTLDDANQTAVVDGKFCNDVAIPDVTQCKASHSKITGTYQFKFDTAGTYRYFCNVHGYMMRGQIAVSP